MVADGNDRLGCRRVIPLAPEFPKMTKLPTGEIRRSLRIATWEGSFGAVHANPVNNAFLTGSALTWGANDFLLALFGSIPFLAAPGQLLGAHLVDRWADRRREMVALSGFDRVAVRTFRGVAWENLRPLIGFLSCYGSLNPGKRRQFSCPPSY
jgi:hypothetical protein